jgi:coenzyme F420-reducing hydrogenase gamma subunit
MGKPVVGIFGLTGCAGDQLVIINCEDELLDIVNAVDIRDFLMASSDNDTACALDVALVEGAVMSARDQERLKEIRARAKLLVAIGTCAVWGGVAAASFNGRRGECLAEVYGEVGAGYDTMPARALHEVVKVDLNISGCPIEKHQFISAISSLLNGDPPVLPQYAVCTECRMRENNCLLLEKGEVCCGPLTVAGCEARCPTLGIRCVGCRGPADDANVKSALAVFEEKRIPFEQIAKKLGTFAPLRDAPTAGPGGHS